MRGRRWIREEKEDKGRGGLEKGVSFWLSNIFNSCEGEKKLEKGRRREEAVWGLCICASVLHLFFLQLA
jgi:hypothetical protein